MLVDVVGGVLVTKMLAHDRVVQAACLGRRTFLAAQVPVIVGVLLLVRCELISSMCFIVSWKHSMFSSSESSKPPSHEGSDPGMPCSAAEAAGTPCSATEAALLFFVTSSRCLWQRRTQEMKLLGFLASFHITVDVEFLVVFGGEKAT